MPLKKTLAPIFFYTSNLMGPYQAAAFVLRCFDARFRHVFDAFIRQPFQYSHLCARSLAVETCLPF